MNEWLQSNWHLIAFVVAIVLATGRIIYRMSKWEGMVETELKWLRKSIDSIDAKISGILERLPTPKLVETSSPVHLTRFGKKISENLSIRSWAEDHAKRLAREASGKIFEICVKYIACLADEDPDFDEKIRKEAYESGVDVDQLRKVYEVELRDAILN